jgi:hypothetical protein
MIQWRGKFYDCNNMNIVCEITIIGSKYPGIFIKISMTQDISHYQMESGLIIKIKFKIKLN